MSHYSVAVITKNGLESEIDELLSPFDENIEVDKHLLYTKEEIIKKAKEEIEEYKNTVYAEFLDNPEEYSKKHNDISHLKYLKNTFPEKLKWTDEEIYEDYIDRYNKSLIVDGDVYSTYNPESKYDYYIIGGRYSNLILSKDGYYCNSDLISNIVMSYPPTKEDKKEREELYNCYKKVLKSEYLEKEFGKLEDYLNKPIEFRTYAILLPTGEWIEPGEMGWFGLSLTSDDSQKEYDDKYYSILEEYKDYYLTIVDCHI